MTDVPAAAYPMDGDDPAFPFVTTKANGGRWDDAGYARGFEVGIVVGYLGAINEHVPASANRPPFNRIVPLTELPVLGLAASFLGYEMLCLPGDAERAGHPTVDVWERVSVSFRYVGNRDITPEAVIG